MDEGLEAVVYTLAAAAVFKKPKLFKIRNTLDSFVDTDEISIPENEPFEFTGVLGAKASPCSTTVNALKHRVYSQSMGAAVNYRRR